MSLIIDKRGVPVMLADVAPSGVSKVDPNAASGNPRHDTRSGKFGAGGGGARRPTAPANIDQASYLRMLDAVREAARTFSGTLTPENIQSFIKKRAANPGAVNIQAFLQAAAQQQMHDVVDLLDAELRTVKGPKLSAPRGYVQKVLRGATDDDVAEIVARLAARGNSAESAARLVTGKAGKERKEKIQAKVAASDFENTEWAVEMTEFEDKTDIIQLVFEQVVAEINERHAQETPPPPPVIEFQPNITVEFPKHAVAKTIERDANGLAVRVTEEIVDGS